METSSRSRRHSRKVNRNYSLDPSSLPGTSKASKLVINQLKANQDEEDDLAARFCWICFGCEEENPGVPWVKPCKCKGSTKWAHQRCLSLWIAQKQRGNLLRPVRCPQCNVAYILVLPRMATFAEFLERIDSYITDLTPVWSGILTTVSAFFAAWTYGAFTFCQIMGFDHGLPFMESGNRAVLLFGPPAIPFCLIMTRLFPWERTLTYLLISPLKALGAMFQTREGENSHRMQAIDSPPPENEANNSVFNLPSRDIATEMQKIQVISGALLLPSISVTVGQIFYTSVANNLHRALYGGLTYLILKNVSSLYLRNEQFKRNSQRRVLDHSPEEDYTTTLPALTQRIRNPDRRH